MTLATLTAALLYAFKISDLCEEEGSYKIFYALGHVIDVNALLSYGSQVCRSLLKPCSELFPIIRECVIIYGHFCSPELYYV